MTIKAWFLAFALVATSQLFTACSEWDGTETADASSYPDMVIDPSHNIPPDYIFNPPTLSP